MKDLLNLVAQQGAEEFRLAPGRPPVMVLEGKARVMDGGLVTSESVNDLFRGIATTEQQRELELCGKIRFSYSAQGSARFSVHATKLGDDLTLMIRNLGR